MSTTRHLTYAAIIAALYVALTYLSNLFGLANGVVQFRLSEMLTILPLFTSAALPGLTIGCLIANALTGCTFVDIVFGTLATLVGALGVRYMRTLDGKLPVLLSPLFPIVSNTLIISPVLWFSFPDKSIIYIMLTIFIGEFVCCALLGLPLFQAIKKSKIFDKLS